MVGGVSLEQAYKLILDNIRDVVWTSDLDLNCTYVSPTIQAFRNFDLPPDCDPAKLTELFSREILPAARGAFEGRRAELDKGPACLTFPFRLASGREIVVESELNYLRDARGIPTGFVGVARDISEAAAAEEALARTTTLFNNIVESIAEVIIVWNLDNTPAFISPGIKSLLGYTPEEFTSQHKDLFGLTAIMTSDSLTRVEKEGTAVSRLSRPS